ncbi:hypothetical protein TNCV_1773321 [Trichonephila clavipes]|nr:hypothetical protein TNCV_1773321 [Trichonephila clavipes]
MVVRFRNEKVSNHGSIPITIDCNVVAFIVFEEGFLQPIKRTKQMSRPNRGGPSSSSTSTNGATGGGGTGIPVPVVQQAQQYLEENIKAWMEPTPPTQSREDSTDGVCVSLAPLQFTLGILASNVRLVSDCERPWNSRFCFPAASTNT